MGRPQSSEYKRSVRSTLNKALEGHENRELASFFAHASTNGLESGLIEFAARVCYNSTAKLGASPSFVRNVLDSGHLSVAEHPVIAIHLRTLVGKERVHDLQNTFLYFTKYSRFFTLYNGFVVGNFRCWLELIANKGATFKNFEEVIAALPEAFDTTPIFPDHVLEYKTFRNYVHVPTYADESGLRISLLAANVDIPIQTSGFAFAHAIGGQGFGRFSWLVEGISRNCGNQIARHRGASISQESQRYVDAMKHPMFVYPPDASSSQRASLEAFNLQALEKYKELRDGGMRKEDARFALPGGIATRMVLSFDTPDLVHFLRVRCAKDAQWEVRRMAQIMAEQSLLALPNKDIEEIVKWKEN